MDKSYPTLIKLSLTCHKQTHFYPNLIFTQKAQKDGMVVYSISPNVRLEKQEKHSSLLNKNAVWQKAIVAPETSLRRCD